MIKMVLGYYDKRIGCYISPQFQEQVSIEDLIEDVRRMTYAPNFRVEMFDYDLYLLGTFDDKLGSFDLKAKPDFIVSLDDFRPRGEVHG